MQAIQAAVRDAYAGFAAWLRMVPAWLVEPQVMVVMGRIRTAIDRLNEVADEELARSEDAVAMMARFRELEIEVSARTM